MMNSKASIQEIQIISTLLNTEYTTIKNIANQVNLSEKTIRNKIDLINDFLEENDMGCIEKKPRVGVVLHANDEQIRKLYFYISENLDKESIGTTGDINRVIEILLKAYGHSFVSTQSLSDALYISAPTTLKIIQKVKEWFHGFNIDLINSRQDGIYLDASEYDYRIALSYYISNTNNQVEETLLKFIKNYNVNSIKKIIMKTEKEWDIALDEKSFNNVLVNIIILMHRSQYSKYLTISMEDLVTLEKYNEYTFSSSILNKLAHDTGIFIYEQEYWFLAIQILCSRFVSDKAEKQSLETLVGYDTTLISFTESMIELVGSVLNVDLSHDKILHSDLLQHLRPTIFRMRYGIQQSNSLLHYIKDEYKQAYVACWSTSVLFEKTYGLDVTEKEIGYIAIYFTLAIQRIRQPISAIFITSDSISYTNLMCQIISTHISNITNIEVINNHDYKEEDFRDIDIIFSDRPLFYTDYRNIVVYDRFMEESIASIEEQIQRILEQRMHKVKRLSPLCHSLFDVELIFVQEQFKDKEELIRFVCSKLVERGCTTDKFVDSVLKHENLTSTAIGFGAAIPHGSQFEINESRIPVVLLDKPILWDDEEMVDTVFLLGVKMTTKNEYIKTRLFYKQYIQLIESRESIEEFRKFKTNFEVYNYLLG